MTSIRSIHGGEGNLPPIPNSPLESVPMSKNTNPWFKFYPQDWLDSERVMEMSFAAKGLYIECLAHQHKKGSIPADLGKIARLLRANKAEVEALWPEVKAHFRKETVNDQERLYNPRLRREIQATEEKQNRYSSGSKKGHESRKKISDNEESENNPKQIPLDSQHNPTKNPALHASVSVSVSDSASESVSEDEKERAPEPPGAKRETAQAARTFEIFWQAWPSPRKDKQAALKAWLKIKPDQQKLQSILAGLRIAKESRQWARGFIPSPATWLNNARWEDESDDTPAGTDQNTPAVESDPLPEFTPMDPTVWESARYGLQHEDPDAWEAWLSTLQPMGYAGDEIWLAAGSTIQRNFAAQCRDLLVRHLQAPVKIIVMPEALQ